MHPEIPTASDATFEFLSDVGAIEVALSEIDVLLGVRLAADLDTEPSVVNAVRETTEPLEHLKEQLLNSSGACGEGWMRNTMGD